MNFALADATDIARAENDARIARAAGFTLPATVVPFGTKVIPEGQDRYRQSRATWEDMAGAGAVLAGLGDRVRAERRSERVMALRDLEMAPTGELQRRIGQTRPLPLSRHAWEQLSRLSYTPEVPEGQDSPGRVRLLPGGADKYLSDPMTPIARRAAEVSYHLSQAHAGGRALLRLRERQEGEIFAVLSPAYCTDADADKVADMLAARKFPGARGQAMYDGSKWSIDVLWHSAIEQGESVVAGEIFQAGVRIQSADDGTGKLRVQALLWRNLCLNFLVIGTACKETSTHHVRWSGTMGTWLQQAVDSALTSIDGFAGRWAEATKTAILGQHFGEPAEAFGKLVDLDFISPPEGSGLSDKDYVDRLVSAYYAEQGQGAYVTVAATINALTRAAHSTPWASAWMSQEQEEQAGQLYQTVKVWAAA